MAYNDSDQQLTYAVVVNSEEQYSIWPVSRKIPAGWEAVPETGTRDECLEYITQVWTDMRPLSVRKSMKQAVPDPSVDAR